MNQKKLALLQEMDDIRKSITEELKAGKLPHELNKLFSELGQTMTEIDRLAEEENYAELPIQIMPQSQTVMALADGFINSMMANPAINSIGDREAVVDCAINSAKDLVSKIFDTKEYRQEVRMGIANKAIRDVLQ